MLDENYKITDYFHDEVVALFSIQWDEECSLWKKLPWYCCSVISDKSQPPLHKEAANWMIKRMTTEGCLIAPVDVFKKGILDILI